MPERETDSMPDDGGAANGPSDSTGLRLFRVLLYGGIFLIVMRTLSPALVPVLQAAFLTVIASQLVGWLRRRHLSHSLSVVIVVLGLTAVLVLLGSILAASVADMRRQLPVYENRMDSLIEDFATWVAGLNLGLPVDSIVPIPEPAVLLQIAARTAGGLGVTLARTILVLVLVLFALLEMPHGAGRLEAITRNTRIDLHQWSGFAADINHYLIIKTWIGFGTGLTAAGLLAAVGVDYALLWGLLTFVLNYIPNLGSILAGVPPGLLALLEHGWATTGVVILVYIGVNIVFASLLEPRFMGEGLGISPVVVILSLVVWGWTFGLTGIFLAVPLTMLVRCFLESTEENRWISVLLGLRRSLPPDDSRASREAPVQEPA